MKTCCWSRQEKRWEWFRSGWSGPSSCSTSDTPFDSPYISKNHKSSTIWFSFHSHLSCDLISPCFLPFLSAGNQTLPPGIMSVDELVIFSCYWHRVWDYVIASSRKKIILNDELQGKFNTICMTWAMTQMY